MKKFMVIAFVAAVFSGSAFAAMDAAQSAKCADIIKNLRKKAQDQAQGASDGKAADSKDAK